MSELLIGTDQGVVRPDGSVTQVTRVRHLAPGPDGWWMVDPGAVWRLDGEWDKVATAPEGATLHCLLAAGGEVVVGAGEARLYRLEGDGLVEDETFLHAPGRHKWYTPWGRPPDVRSMAAGEDGSVFVNVHVGGILRRRPGGEWEQLVDIEADVHQVITAHRVVLAATAVGLAVSRDGGDTFEFFTEGLHATYCRAVAADAETVVVSASTGPGGRQAAVYRSDLASIGFERCTEGLPAWFSTNVDTGCLAAAGGELFAGDPSGVVYRSADAGVSWEVALEGLGRIMALAVL